MDELLDPVLHAPVPELHPAQFVGTHDIRAAVVREELPILINLPPVLRHGTPPCLLGLEGPGVLFFGVVPAADGVVHKVYQIWQKQGQNRMTGFDQTQPTAWSKLQSSDCYMMCF